MMFERKAAHRCRWRFPHYTMLTGELMFGNEPGERMLARAHKSLARNARPALQHFVRRECHSNSAVTPRGSKTPRSRYRCHKLMRTAFDKLAKQEEEGLALAGIEWIQGLSGNLPGGGDHSCQHFPSLLGKFGNHLAPIGPIGLQGPTGEQGPRGEVQVP